MAVIVSSPQLLSTLKGWIELEGPEAALIWNRPKIGTTESMIRSLVIESMESFTEEIGKPEESSME